MPKEKESSTGNISREVKHRNIVSLPHDRKYLDSGQLIKLEQSFRNWTETALRADVRLSRRRILFIFLLIRYTGAKLNEVLALDPLRDINYKKQSVYFRSAETDVREVPVSKALCGEVDAMLADAGFRKSVEKTFSIDPGFVRRKFYERAQECGFSKELGGPEMIRKSRAVELMQGNMPLPAVQKMLGHSTPNLTSSYVSFSEEDVRQVTKHFMENESARRTSARNTFFGKIAALQRGDVQTLVELSTIEGHRIATIITNDSVERLGLKKGQMITAEVKAPSVLIQKSDQEPESSAENRFRGVIEQLKIGNINTECVVGISDSVRLCSIITSESCKQLKLKKNAPVWAMFSCFAVVLHVD